MPLDPSISLQVRPPQFQAPDFGQTLLTIGQLQSMQQQNALRQLQMGDLAYKLQTYRNLQDPQGALAQLVALRSGQAQPIGTQNGTVAPPPGTGAPPVASVQTPTADMGPSVPAGQYNPYEGNPGLAPEAPVAPAPAPSQPPPQAQPQPQPQGQPQGQPDIMADVQRQRVLYDRMYMQGHPEVVGPIVDRFMAMDKHLMEQQKGQLDFALASNNAMAQIADSVQSRPEAERPAAWQQARSVAILRGIPGAQQWPEQYSPQIVGALAAQALSAKDRGEQQLAAWGRANDEFKNWTERFKERREAGEIVRTETMQGPQFTYKYLPPGAAGPYAPGSVGGAGITPEAARVGVEAAREQRERTEVTPMMDIHGNLSYAPKYNVPEARTGGLPMPGPGFVGLEAGSKQREAERASAEQWKAESEPYRAMNEAMTTVNRLANQKTNVSDTALINAFTQLAEARMRAGGPGAEALQAPGGLPQQLDYWKKWVGGTNTLPDDVRQDFVQTAQNLFAGQKEYYQGLYQNRRATASKQQLDPENAVPDYLAPGTQSQRLGQPDIEQRMQMIGQRLGLPQGVIELAKAITFGGERSTGDPLAVSPKGAVGLMQIMPDTAKPFKISRTDLNNPDKNIEAGLKYIQQLWQQFPGRPDLIAAAYNAGPPRVQAAGNAVPDIAETQGHVYRTMQYLQQRRPQTAVPQAAPPAVAPQAAPPVAPQAAPQAAPQVAPQAAPQAAAPAPAAAGDALAQRIQALQNEIARREAAQRAQRLQENRRRFMGVR